MGGYAPPVNVACLSSKAIYFFASVAGVAGMVFLSSCCTVRADWSALFF